MYFPAEESEVIGEGGEDAGPPSDDEDDPVDEEDWSPAQVEDDPQERERERVSQPPSWTRRGLSRCSVALALRSIARQAVVEGSPRPVFSHSDIFRCIHSRASKKKSSFLTQNSSELVVRP